jgi:hypothetical protein
VIPTIKLEDAPLMSSYILKFYTCRDLRQTAEWCDYAEDELWPRIYDWGLLLAKLRAMSPDLPNHGGRFYDVIGGLQLRMSRAARLAGVRMQMF